MIEQLPQKSLFKLNEVCQLLDLKPYVLQYWETEFPEMASIQTSSGQRVYAYDDVELIQRIRQWLLIDKMTIEQVKRKLFEMFKSSDVEAKKVLAGAGNDVAGPTTSFVRAFNELEIQKLIITRAKLQSIVSRLNAIKEQYQWK